MWHQRSWYDRVAFVTDKRPSPMGNPVTRTELSAHLASGEPRDLSTRDGIDRTAEFASAWAAFDRAASLRDQLNRQWSDACDVGFDASVTTFPDLRGEITVQMDWTHETTLAMNATARELGSSLNECLDLAVQETASVVSGALQAPDRDLLRFPLTISSEEFLAAYTRGEMTGLRPDHVQLIERCQPMSRPNQPRAGWETVHSALEFLIDLNAVPPAQPCVGAWAHMAGPQVLVDNPFTVDDLTIDPDGLVAPSKRVATYRIAGPAGLQSPPVRANPNVAFDLVPTFGPPPAGDGDFFSGRARRLFIVVRYLIEGFESSLGLRPSDVLDHWRATARVEAAALPTLPDWSVLRDSPGGSWQAEARAVVAESDVGIATTSGGAQLVIFVESNGEVYQRRIPAPTALNPRLAQGLGAEDATHSAVVRWGLSDFIFPPEKRRTGSGTRELGDGIVYLGESGLILQVKSRNTPGDKQGREGLWITKNVTKGASQAAGTLRQLRRQPALMTNQRGRPVLIDGNTASWIGVVIVDHPNPPSGIVPETSNGRIPFVTLLRRDWEFLFAQLGSTAAVAAYLHRVAGEPNELGDEPVRYYDLARKDLEAEPGLVREDWVASLQGAVSSRPLLPQQPAHASRGQVLFRMVLNDIAESPLTAAESDRLTLLGQLDGTPVAHQAEIGDRLISLLQQAPSVAPGNIKIDYRWLTDTQRPRQVAFTVCNQLSDQLRETFRQRLLLQHHRMTQFDWKNEESVTTGVLLTPNYVHPRGWDTTVLSLRGATSLTPAEVDSLEQFFDGAPSMPSEHEQ